MLGIEIQPESLALGALVGIGYGLLGAGLVLTFRASRVINLAHGQIGAFAAVILAVAVLRWDAPYWAAFPGALAVGAGLAAVVEIVVVRRLRRAPAVMTLIATLGIAQVLLLVTVAIAASLPPGELFPPPPGLPDTRLGALLVAPNHLALLILAPMLAGATAITLRRTMLGLAIRAGTSNPEGARALGIPARRLTAAVWGLAGAFAAFTAILVLPAGGPIATEALGPSLLLRALAAAVLARLASAPGALFAGVGIGVVESVVHWNAPRGDLTELLLFAALFAAFALRPRGDPATAEASRWMAVSRWRRLPPAARAVPTVRLAGPVLLGAALAAAAALPALVGPAHEVRLAVVACVALAALSVWVVTGLGGMLSLGQFGVAGVGALLVVWIADGTGSVLLGFAGAIGGCAVLGALVGTAAIRTGPMGFAVVTLALALAVSGWLLDKPWALGEGREVPPLSVGPVDAGSPAGAYWLALVALAGVLLAARALVRGRAGRRLVALRDNEVAATLLGVRAASARLGAAALAGAIAGLAGALVTQALFEVTADSFAVGRSLDAVAVAAVGGLSIAGGALLGALYVVALPSFADLSAAAAAATALGWTLLIIEFPGGLAEILEPLRQRGIRLLLRLSGHDPALLTTPTPAATRPPVRSLPPQAPATVRVRGLTKSFGAIRAVDAVELEVAAGSAVAVIGPNGAGKSTLLDIVCGLTRPDAGRVLLADADVTSLPAAARARRGLGRSLQDPVLFGTLTVAETIALGMESRHTGGQLGRAAELAASVGLEQCVDHEIRSLSTGMRRVVEVAAVVALEPRVLLLDEPSAGLAQRERDALVELLRRVRGQLGATLVLVEHDMSVVAGLAERVVVLERGRIVADGRTADVLGAPTRIAAESSRA